MLLTDNLLNLFVAGICVFLIGVNVAFVLELWGRLAGWFITKMLGITGLLTYVAFSVLFGNPTAWRVGIAFVAVAIDLLAFVWMYQAVDELQRSGVVGLIPLSRITGDRGEKGDKGEPGPEGPRGPRGYRGASG